LGGGSFVVISFDGNFNLGDLDFEMGGSFVVFQSFGGSETFVLVNFSWVFRG
jgi:hypothetical protein